MGDTDHDRDPGEPITWKNTPINNPPTRERAQANGTLVEATIADVSESELDWSHDRDQTAYANLKALVRELHDREDIDVDRRLRDGTVAEFAFATILGLGPKSLPSATDAVREDLAGEQRRSAIWWETRARVLAENQSDLGALPESGPPDAVDISMTELRTVAEDDDSDGGDADAKSHNGPDSDSRPEPDSSPEPSTEETTDDKTADVPRAIASRSFYPPGLKALDVWTPTARDSQDRKRPRAPHINGHCYPAKWNDELPAEERPETSFEEARRWASFSAYELDAMGCPMPDTDRDDDLKLGVILPRDRPPIEDRATLIDWDDVRDPETDEIHPICAAYLRRCDGYAEISVTKTGVHQFVYGGLGDGGKFIASIDDEPFIGEPEDSDDDDLPQVEIYDGGRHTLMTGNHVDGTGEDLVAGQDLIEELVDRFADNATAIPRGMGISRPSSPRPADNDGEQGGDRSINGPDPQASGRKAEFGEYDLDEDSIPDERPRCYHAMLKNREDAGHKPLPNWQGLYFIGLLGDAAGLERKTILEDLKDHGTPEYGFDRARAEDQIDYALSASHSPPSTNTLYQLGIIDTPGCSPECPVHVPGDGDPARSRTLNSATRERDQEQAGSGCEYTRTPTWALRNVAYHAGHDPDNDVWRDTQTGRAIADNPALAGEINEKTDATVYRALPARIHNMVLDILEEAGREDDHGREPRQVTDDMPIRGGDSGLEIS